MSEPFDISPDQPRCVVLSDLRGDYRLLLTLLSQLARVAKFDPNTRQWQWTATNTVVVCLGNYTNRFEPRGINRLTISTHDAIQDELRILETFFQLEQPNDQGNALVVLAGNHELANVLDLPGYEYYQMARPQEADDRRLRQTFVRESLWPFVQRHGVVAGWGRPGGTVYFSHGSLHRKWLQRMKVTSLEDLNRKWRHWLSTHQTHQLSRWADADSPLFSSEMALKPQIWREFDQEFVVRLMGEDPNPRFVQSTLIPVQRLHFYSFDTNLKEPQFDCPKRHGERPTMLVSRNFDAIDQFYFIHNAMADTFCMYEDVDRQPQALEFRLKLNNMREALYLQVQPIVMGFEEYQRYLRELPYGSCLPPPEQTPRPLALLPPLTPEEQVALRPSLSEGTIEVLNAGFSHVEKVGLVVLSHDLSHIFLVQHPDHPDQWMVPMGARLPDENDWDALLRVLKDTVGLDHLEFVRGGTVSDFEGSTRVWFKRTLQSLTSPRGQWVKLDDLLTFPLTRPCKTMLCVFSRNQLLPELKNFHTECPSWLKADDPELRHRIQPWWTLREGEPYVVQNKPS